MSNLLLYAIPAFLLSLWLERAWAARQTDGAVRGYENRDTLASLGLGLGNVLISAFSTPGAVALWQLAYEHRLLQVGRAHALWVWPLLFLSEDLCSYWFHRGFVRTFREHHTDQLDITRHDAIETNGDEFIFSSPVHFVLLFMIHSPLTTGWLNPLLDATRFFRRAEWFLAKIGIQRSN